MTIPEAAPATFGYTIVYVPDVEVALDFYTRAFGVPRGFLHDSGMYGELDTGATKLAFANERFCPVASLFEPNRPEKAAPGMEVGFVVDDVEKAYQRALDAGATSASAPEQKPWGQTVAYVRDVHGVLVELCTAVRSS